MAIHITNLNGGDITIGSTSTGYTVTIDNPTEMEDWWITVVRNGQTETITSGTQVTNVTQINGVGGDATYFTLAGDPDENQIGS